MALRPTLNAISQPRLNRTPLRSRLSPLVGHLETISGHSTSCPAVGRPEFAQTSLKCPISPGPGAPTQRTNKRHHVVMMKDVAHIPDSADGARWVVNGIIGFAESVLSLVQSGFEAYARIFHPAVPGGHFENLESGQVPMSWSEVAAIKGTTAHRAMQWPSLIGTYSNQSFFPDVEPGMGSLPPPVAEALAEILKEHTDAPQHCCFGTWDGYGGMSDFVRAGPTFNLPNRRYHLLTGPTETLVESVNDPLVEQSANLWWPEDRAWCVATEIDLQSTYVGGDRACIVHLFEDERLGVYEVEPSDGVTWSDDTAIRTQMSPSPYKRYDARVPALTSYHHCTSVGADVLTVTSRPCLISTIEAPAEPARPSKM
jgi:hypothetical protein